MLGWLKSSIINYTHYSAGFVTTDISTDSLRKSQTYVLTCKKTRKPECHRGPDTVVVKVNEACERHGGETLKSLGIKIKDSVRRSRGGLMPKMLP